MCQLRKRSETIWRKREENQIAHRIDEIFFLNSIYEMEVDFHWRRSLERCRTKENLLLSPLKKLFSIRMWLKFNTLSADFSQIESIDTENDDVRWIFNGTMMHLKISIKARNMWFLLKLINVKDNWQWKNRREHVQLSFLFQTNVPVSCFQF